MTRMSLIAVYACAVLFILVRVVCAQECSKCRCCAEGHRRNCASTGFCKNGCMDGYYGRNCIHKCTSQKCLSCHRNGGNYCLKCKSGYYLKKRNHICYNCKSNCKSCDSLHRCQSCNDGYWGNTCQLICTEKCVSCRQDGYCLSCEPGYIGSTCDQCAIGRFGNTCQYQCSRDCKNGHCDEENAVCRCSTNYTGETCDQCANGRFGKTCQYECSRNCKNGLCDEKNAVCLCTSNYKGETCDQCANGRFGKTCQYWCSRDCKYGHCDEENAVCRCSPNFQGETCDQCANGRFGKTCHYECSRDCRNGHCDEENAVCRCSTNYKGEICDQCANGRFGKTCQYWCSRDCKNGHCDEENAVCRCSPNFQGETCDQCANGRFGKTCQYECSRDCRNGHCDEENAVCRCSTNYKGEICDQCANGRFGKTCQYRCYRDCKNGHCDEENSVCRCSPNYTGETCDQCSNGRFGKTCQYECSRDCKNGHCDEVNAICRCNLNYKGKTCDQCSSGRFGEKCEQSCSLGCDFGNCTRYTGFCSCKFGWSDQRCNTLIETEVEQHKQSNAALVGGVGGGVIAFAGIVVIGLVLFRRRRDNLSRNKGNSTEQEPENVSALYATVSIGNEDDITAREITVMFEENGGIYYNNAQEVSNFKRTVGELPEYVQYLCIKDLEEEFQRIPYGLIKPYEVSQTKFNMQRNRYKGIYPYDDSRVVVRGGDTDYINASYVDGFRKRKAYIAALGPMAKQLGDFGQFWRMVWQQKVEKIVMVTNLVEGEKTKCEQYWPEHGQSKLYGDIEIVCKVERLYADFIWRQFTFSKGISQNSEERNLHHLQFTAWPDKDIPDSVTSIIEFRQIVNALPSTFAGPVIVHCSAGVGRTGTYIALDILTNEGEAEGAIDIPGCVLNMRQNRPSMIQTLNQYKYLHQALVHSLTLDYSLIKREHFVEYMNMMSSKQEMQKQFEKMQLNQEQKSDHELQATENNRLLTKKNRKHADIPGDSNRPRLYLFLKPGESDYINAIYINSFKTENRFLVAQTPLSDTVSDFIALAVQENCSCIVSMEAQGNGLYVPGDNLSMKKGVISILSARDQSTRHFVKRMLHFEHDGKTKMRIPHYEYLDWDRNQNTPRSVELFVAFIKEIEDASKSSHMNGPILVHCMNGAGKSGLLCVVSTLLETLRDINEVSVVNSVMKVRARRPFSIPNKEQFYFCYECVLQSLNETDNDVYYNTSGDIQRE